MFQQKNNQTINHNLSKDEPFATIQRVHQQKKTIVEEKVYVHAAAAHTYMYYWRPTIDQNSIKAVDLCTLSSPMPQIRIMACLIKTLLYISKHRTQHMEWKGTQHI